ncbi:hypothetical protein IOD16_11835 [Saccharothrix sp. 6-C]|uniref:hypothetical protein n=1 Tax=Saccharothrix sp. 6-C TaxID=2781735 RepID=UPI00191744B1|nr:hypothetical protein [Saccharothrix sp. 6-C]QQQ79051.1 hypothetical protein IOD16_11835 [Saccharothrix sp. 6-C]
MNRAGNARPCASAILVVGSADTKSPGGGRNVPTASNSAYSTSVWHSRASVRAGSAGSASATGPNRTGS